MGEELPLPWEAEALNPSGARTDLLLLVSLLNPTGGLENKLKPQRDAGRSASSSLPSPVHPHPR